MNPPCGRCTKPVYPTEKINCLDKYWHKGCFSCDVCKMALSMNNYKGFEKRPYCSMHYPKTSFTIVADTPENLRLKQQSMLNSQALYKEEFEKNKGKGFSVVVDTPEMQRLKKTQEQISDIKYHEDFERSKVRSDAPLPENRTVEPSRCTDAPSCYCGAIWWREALPGHVQLHGGRSRRGFPAGGRPHRGRGAHRRGLAVWQQPAHGPAGHAARKLRAACVMAQRCHSPVIATWNQKFSIFTFRISGKPCIPQGVLQINVGYIGSIKKKKKKKKKKKNAVIKIGLF
ncbi:LIM and SH3 domain protein 1-like isoform X1 [Phyllopteryx taeniolatus]|uniref:LIM and SH3 domain protein 1-like isoform X1 n=1 Tax=Phyllopteryx taeniolatus TaxID=161469 RepID=UPI002AD23DA7|nr:LIM and SH3 domain protein 1-like isoform X1 [Phyllopteryx taeniolatus]